MTMSATDNEPPAPAAEWAPEPPTELAPEPAAELAPEPAAEPSASHAPAAEPSASHVPADPQERLEAAFHRYDEAFHARRSTPPVELAAARMDLSLLLLAEDGDAPTEVREQLAADGEELLKDTPPL